MRNNVNLVGSFFCGSYDPEKRVEIQIFDSKRQILTQQSTTQCKSKWLVDFSNVYVVHFAHKFVNPLKRVHKKWFSMIHVKRDLKRFGNVFFFLLIVVVVVGSLWPSKRSLSKRSVRNYKCVCYLISVNLLTMFALLSRITKSVKIHKFIAIFGSKIDAARKINTPSYGFFLSMSSCSFLR